MSEKSEALRLADLLEMGSLWPDREAAARELRRQDKEIEALKARAESAEANLCNTQIAWENWKVMHSTTRLEAEMQRRAAAYDGLIAQRDALLAALKEAATSLETVGRLAGKSDYLGDDGERIPTYMGRHDEVREYATSRAGVARAAIKAVEEGK